MNVDGRGRRNVNWGGVINSRSGVVISAVIVGTSVVIPTIVWSVVRPITNSDSDAGGYADPDSDGNARSTCDRGVRPKHRG